ncbi:hypothetical protein ACMCNP_06830 [Candidatus Acidulodesulfobacterium sp. H_13]|uniref:hypothetical protein n=1 Tax=Candidatus Acidulodesulfobacterium sp. H_13 TaxID=3395470 RepID=UPI003AF643DC
MPRIILAVVIIAVLEPRIYNSVLKLYQPFLLTEVLFFGKFQGCNGLYVLNFKGRLCLFVIEVAQCPAKKFRWVRGNNILTSFTQISGIQFGEFLCSSDNRAEGLGTEDVVEYTMPPGFSPAGGGVIFPCIWCINIVAEVMSFMGRCLPVRNS